MLIVARFRILRTASPCSHPLRDLKGISENYGQRWSEQLHDLIQEIKNEVDGVRDQSGSPGHQKTADFKGRFSLIIKEGIRNNPIPDNAVLAIKCGRKKQSKAKNLLDCYQKFQIEILSFMRDLSIPFSNNQAERGIRIVKLQQKISGTFRSEDGAASFCRVRGYLSTVKKNELPVLAYLVGAF